MSPNNSYDDPVDPNASTARVPQKEKPEIDAIGYVLLGQLGILLLIASPIVGPLYLAGRLFMWLRPDLKEGFATNGRAHCGLVPPPPPWKKS